MESYVYHDDDMDKDSRPPSCYMLKYRGVTYWSCYRIHLRDWLDDKYSSPAYSTKRGLWPLFFLYNKCVATYTKNKSHCMTQRFCQNLLVSCLDSDRIMRGEKMYPYPPLHYGSLYGGDHAQSTITLTIRWVATLWRHIRWLGGGKSKTQWLLWMSNRVRLIRSKFMQEDL